MWSGARSLPASVDGAIAGVKPIRAPTPDGNGPFGLGWNLSLPLITRKTDKGLPRYNDDEESDVFILSDAEDLVPVLNDDDTPYEDTDRAPGTGIPVKALPRKLSSVSAIAIDYVPQGNVQQETMRNRLLSLICVIGLSPGLLLAQTGTEVTFARVETSVQIREDLRITSLGGFGVSDRKVGHIDLVFIDSDDKDEGNTLGVELGGAFAFKLGATFYLGAGALLGYDTEEDFVATVYPELGVALTFGKFGVIANGKYYLDLKGDSEEVVMLGLLYKIGA